ncbi:hypothetical protein SteCoe_8391 [Stentor coeruleus]|uniref:Uncharacterized protein n=1 Tax=Stentor coeruleus TaxID=5963 RepID=A0A1R2CKE0_9CILI|nr:hypothetical protein SteCoe_8391 [Stentor coeruleus]
MSNPQNENSSTQDELAQMSPIKKSILRSKSLIPEVRRRHQEANRLPKRQKSVSFPDKNKMPIHTVYEIPLLKYENHSMPKPASIKKSNKKKGCSCIIM